MWHALRAELTYYAPWLLGALGMGVGVVIIISVVFFIVGDNGPPHHVAAGIRGMFLIMAPMILAFIVQGLRSEEHRARLLMAGPLTPAQIAGAMVLLPVVLFGIGVLAAGLVFGAAALVSGKLELESLHIAGFVGGQMFAYAQMGLLAQEAAAAYGQRRLRAAAAGWASFVVVVLLLPVLYLVLGLQLLTWTHVFLGHLVVVPVAMAASVALYTGRTDFTR
jgi:hypothetical protein